MSSTSILWWFKLFLNLVVEGKSYLLERWTNDTHQMSASINIITTVIRTGSVQLLFPVCDQYNLFYEATIENRNTSF